jgi:hypothetical protein
MYCTNGWTAAISGADCSSTRALRLGAASTRVDRASRSSRAHASLRSSPPSCSRQHPGRGPQRAPNARPITQPSSTPLPAPRRRAKRSWLQRKPSLRHVSHAARDPSGSVSRASEQLSALPRRARMPICQKHGQPYVRIVCHRFGIYGHKVESMGAQLTCAGLPGSTGLRDSRRTRADGARSLRVRAEAHRSFFAHICMPTAIAEDPFRTTCLQKQLHAFRGLADH